MINFTKKLFFHIFQGFCLKVLDDLFNITPPCIFVVSRLSTVVLRLSKTMLTKLISWSMGPTNHILSKDK